MSEHKQLAEPHEVIVSRQETGFDRACDEAFRRAVIHFGIDTDGHSTRLEEWARFDSWLEVSFKDYTRLGHEHLYTFEARAMKNTDEEEGEEDERAVCKDPTCENEITISGSKYCSTCVPF